jgi:hypothetical protein
MNDTTIPLYSRISLNRDVPEYHLKRGDIATFIDIIPDPEGIEEGYILEVFNAVGESINVVTVPKSAIAPLRSDDIPRVRSLSQPRSRQIKSLTKNNWVIILQPKKKKSKTNRLGSNPSKE